MCLPEEPSTLSALRKLFSHSPTLLCVPLSTKRGISGETCQKRKNVRSALHKQKAIQDPASEFTPFLDIPTYQPVFTWTERNRKPPEKSPHLQCRPQERKGTLPSVAFPCFSSVSPDSHSTKCLIRLCLWLLSLFGQKFFSLTLPIPSPSVHHLGPFFIFYPMHSLRQRATSTTISNTQIIYNIMRPIFIKAKQLKVILYAGYLT